MMSGQNQPLRRSRRLATIIPARQWEGMGYDPTTAQSLEYLQRDLEKFGSERDADEIKLRGRINDEGMLFGGGVPHDELTLTHWQKFAWKVAERQDLQRIKILAVQLPPSVLEVIIPAMHRLRSLSLLSVALGRSGFLRLSSLLKQNASMVELMLGGEAIEGMDVADSLSDAIASHSSLETLYVIRCGLDNAQLLGRIVEGCKGLSSITFDGNMMGSQGAAVLANFISGNPGVDYLGLCDSAFADRDAEIFASSLKTNDRLRHLDLSGNNITDAGRSALLKAVLDTTSMSSIVASNHTCQVRTFDGDFEDPSMEDILEQELGSINSKDVSEGKKIHMKAVLALWLGSSYGPGCGQNIWAPFDLKHFADISLKLMPRVLEVIQEHPKDDAESQKELDIHALSALFHTLRGWQMPSLFTNLHIPSEGAGRKRKRNARR